MRSTSTCASILRGSEPAAVALSLQRGTLATGACLLNSPFHSFVTAPDSLMCTLVILCGGVSVTGPGQLYRVRVRGRHDGCVDAGHARQRDSLLSGRASGGHAPDPACRDPDREPAVAGCRNGDTCDPPGARPARAQPGARGLAARVLVRCRARTRWAGSCWTHRAGVSRRPRYASSRPAGTRPGSTCHAWLPGDTHSRCDRAQGSGPCGRGSCCADGARHGEALQPSFATSVMFVFSRREIGQPSFTPAATCWN